MPACPHGISNGCGCAPCELEEVSRERDELKNVAAALQERAEEAERKLAGLAHEPPMGNKERGVAKLTVTRASKIEEAARACVEALQAIAEDGKGCHSRYGDGCDGACERVAYGPLEQIRLALALLPDVPGATTVPPPVCTGSGTIAADFMAIASSIASEGRCGICGRRVPLMGDGQTIAPHPYR